MSVLFQADLVGFCYLENVGTIGFKPFCGFWAYLKI